MEVIQILENESAEGGRQTSTLTRVGVIELNPLNIYQDQSPNSSTLVKPAIQHNSRDNTNT